MTAESERYKSAYLYAQSLDNSGDSLCWRSSACGEYQELDLSDPQRSAMLHALDYVQNTGRDWPVGSESLECKVTFQGDCLIKIKPLTRDAGGRVAPIILLFNVFCGIRKSAGRMLFDCEALMRREFSSEHRAAIYSLGRVMNWPLFFIVLHIIIYSRKFKND